MTSLLKNLNLVFRGVAVEFAPSMVKGALTIILSNVTVEQVVQWVNHNYTLLDKIPEKYQHELETANLGDLRWLTANWFIEAIKNDKPQLASLFLSWRKGRNWLERQCQLTREKFTSTE